MRVPLILSWKDPFLSGVTADGLVELLDIAPTLLDACGLAPAYGMQGRSLYKLLTGEASLDSFREDVFCEYYKTKMDGSTVAFASMLFDGRYKITQMHTLAESYPQDHKNELYDLATDPGEHINRYDDPAYADVKLRLFERVCNRQALTADPLPLKSAPW